VHEIDIGASQALRRDALGPAAQIGVVVVGAPQADIGAIRSGNERSIAFVGVGDAKQGAAGAKRSVYFILVP
jgi:hypothetical protein